MKKGIIYTLFCLLTLSSISCGSSKMESGLKNLELGMTKHEVINKMGKDYRNEGAVATPNGNIETWSYIDPNILKETNSIIKVNFLDGKLVEWYRVAPSPHHDERPRYDERPRHDEKRN